MMNRLTLEQLKTISKKKGLLPGKVKGKDSVQLTKGKNSALVVITWDEFDAILKRRGLAVYESSGWMRIMRDMPPQ